jgi:transcriptional antiterminator RfaH
MDCEVMNDPISWYVIRTKSKQEDRVGSNLGAWGVEALTPKMRKNHYNQFTGKPTFLITPLFPRYIFARFRPSTMIHKIRYTRGVHSVVSFGGVPAPINDSVIDLIQTRIKEDGLIKVGAQFEPGDKVIIKDGSQKSLDGLFQREIKDRDRVTILLNTLSYQAHAEVEKRFVEKLG